MNADDVKEVIPCPRLFRTDNLMEPVTAMIPYHNHVLPIHGPVPEKYAGVEQVWVAIFEKHGVVLAEIPALKKEHETKAESSRRLDSAA